jgi:dihydroorotate dehydrogenase
MANATFLGLNRALYGLARPLLFRSQAQAAHERTLELLRRLDTHNRAITLLRQFHRLAFDCQSVTVGGVTLPFPLMLAAGFVKGDGFGDEESALAAVKRGDNIIPGWRSMPALVGPVEFGSFTRWPRTGNPGTVIWRDTATLSTQNRVGLRNPGARAAAAFLAQHRDRLPDIFGINIAVSPGVDDLVQQREVIEALDFFIEQPVRPAWFTLNLSCPNTEDDPGGHQTEAQTRALCSAVVKRLQATPLWVKISPDLADAQYAILMRVFAEVGVRAVIATNTLPRPAPDAPGLSAGVGGGQLHDWALAATIRLQQAAAYHNNPVDIIGCGGVMEGRAYRAFIHAGAQAAQYWSALIYRGPLAAALILNEDAHA